MSLYTELSVDQDIEVIKGIQFTLMSPDEIQQRSVAEITTTDTCNGNDPVIGGLFDPRMGVIEHNKKCCTCDQKNTFCPGHFGHINLARAVFFIQFFDTVRKTMTCICYRCSHLLVDVEKKYEDRELSRKAPRQKRFEQVYKAVKKKVCSHCQTVQPNKIVKENNGFLTLSWKDPKDKPVVEGADPPAEGEENKLNLFADDVLPILSRITDADADALGYNKQLNRPEWMICTVFPVPPPSVRPSVRNDTGQRSEDDLTHKLCDIVKTNNTLKLYIEKDVGGNGTGSSKKNIEDYTALLQYHVSTFVDNQVPGLNPSKHRTGRPFRVLRERLKGKEGRIRGNLMGKRVDFSARSVITPDPNISIDELGVPFKIAMSLTVPEVVDQYNYDYLLQCINNGPNTYPGAKFVRKAIDKMRVVTLKKADTGECKVTLEFGDIVDRHMRNGDYVLFNRQPSLHKMSMMGHRIRVMPYDTFRLNVCVTPCFNADFDGDEMNLFGPQSVQTENELIQLAAVPTQIISPRESRPIVSIVQDIATGVYRLTKENIRLTEKQVFNILANTSMFTGVVPEALYKDAHGGDSWSGQQVLGTIFPSTLNVNTGNVKIVNGIFKSGTIDKTVYQDRTNGLIHSVFNDNGPDAARLLFDNTQRIVCDWLVQSGFSVGVSDLVIEQDTAQKIKEAVNDMKRQAYEKIQQIHEGSFKNTSIMSMADFFEQEINGLLNKARDTASKIGLDTIGDENRMLNMIRSKSKGSNLNVAQMIAALGQQNVEGKRIPYGYDDRTLPHYCRYDDGPDARGFAENSFIKGLTPQEFFFHAMGGREGLIDTAVKSVTGDTPIIIQENGISKYVKIGDWIDRHLDAPENKDDVAHFEERQMEYLHLKTKVFIPTTDENGTVTWGEMTAVTRHDPGTELYEIKTSSGKHVIVTESKSLLIWNAGIKKFNEVPTPEIKVGDYVPVTAKLVSPPIVAESIDMSIYFPKNKYIHGSDFNKARVMIENNMKNRIQIQRGWWNANNNKEFTLPYSKKASLTRVLSGRSHIENIVDGVIYSFHGGSRNCGNLPEQFTLNHENGTFIGLFLAEGNGNIKSGTVSITNNDESVKSFAKNWFAKNNITYIEDSRVNHIGGISTSIIGYSRMLAQFFEEFIGNGARNKFVPDIAFVASEEFVVGLLAGYFSGDGTISATSVESGSASARLTEGISMLCTRLGIFGKVFITQLKNNNLGTKNIAPSHRLAIRAQWATQFAEKIVLLVESKNIQLCEMKASNIHRNFPEHNDVVLDKITEINIIDVSKYPKVYDVTVPSTLNFGLANGLQVRDTSDVGYIQRKLVKAMEDCKINHDLTVRNATGGIVQFLYGEDGINAIKLEVQHIDYVDKNTAQMEEEYLITAKDSFVDVLDAPTLTAFLAVQDIEYPRLAAHYLRIVDDREYLITKIFKNKYENRVTYAVSMSRILRNTVALFHTKELNVPSDLSPGYVLDCLDTLENELFLTNNNRGNMLLGILLRTYMSPKVLLFKHKLNRQAFDHVLKEIRLKFYESIAHPSEMVGVVAAQSIGEPATQLSTVKTTRVMVMNLESKIYYGTIGEFVDDLLAKNPTAVHDIGNDSVVMNLSGYKIIGVSNDEKTSWKEISEISRHPANGGMVTVYTKSGKKTCATLSHSFLKRTENSIVPVLGSDLKVGTRIPVSKYTPVITNPMMTIRIGDKDFALDREFGWICGAYAADGSINGNVVRISKIIPEYYAKINVFAASIGCTARQIIKPVHTIKYNKSNPEKLYSSIDTVFTHAALAKFFTENFGNGSYNKKLSGFVFASNLEFIKGVIGGYFDGDGSVNCDYRKGMIRTASVSENLTENMIILISYVGIFGSKCLEIRKEEERGNLYTIQVSRKYAKLFKEEVDFIVKEKSSALDVLIDYVERDDAHSHQEYIDKIPELGNAIAYIGKALALPGQSRNYGRWKKKESIGRNTLCNYISFFEIENDKVTDLTLKANVAEKIAILNQAANSDVVWDEIVKLEYSDDPKEYVYDFTVPGNDSFMVDCNIMVHNTLNTFHSSGISSASKTVRGVPRLKELLSVSKNIKTPSLTIYMKPEPVSVSDTADVNAADAARAAQRRCDELRQEIKTTYICDVIKSSSIYFNPGDSDTDIGNDKEFVQLYQMFGDSELQCGVDKSPWLLRLEFDKAKMSREGLHMQDIHFAIESFYDTSVNCMFSDDNASELIFRIRLSAPTSSGGEMSSSEDLITELKALEQNILENVVIRGVKGIQNAQMDLVSLQRYNPRAAIFENNKEWVITTHGTNLTGILGFPGVDGARTVSNNVHEIYNSLGIEAARACIVNEINECLADVTVNYRHIALLADVMTYKGTLLSIDRHGINRSDIGPLAKCSFEETSDMLIKAGMFAEYDPVNGVSANIMLGQIPPCGTGDANIMIDEEKLLGLVRHDTSKRVPSSWADLVEEEDAAVCTMEGLSFNFTMDGV